MSSTKKPHSNGTGESPGSPASKKRKMLPILIEQNPQVTCCRALRDVKYEIRGPLNIRAMELEAQGHEILKCNIGNPGVFGFEAPEAITKAVKDMVGEAVPYCHQKGLHRARKVIHDRYLNLIKEQHGSINPGLAASTEENIYVGNGVSELIMMAMRGLLNPGDQVLIPSPDYPLWSAAVTLHEGKPVYYDCLPENNFMPKIEDIRRLVTSRTRAIVLINPNNPSGQIYPKELLREIVEMAEEYPFGGLLIFSDEIYDMMTFDSKMWHMAGFVNKTLCCSFGGLSKVWRACGYRVGWMLMSGNLESAKAYTNALNMLSGLRLCSNVLGQYAIEPAVTGSQSVGDLMQPGGRLHEARKVIVEAVQKSKYMTLVTPEGALYAFIKVNLPEFDDQIFALDLVEKKHILIAPGSSFNVPYKDHFRMTLLPWPDQLRKAFADIEDLLNEHAEKIELRKAEALKLVQVMRSGEEKARMLALAAAAKF